MSDPHGILWIVWIIVCIIAISLVVIKGGRKAVQGGRRAIQDRLSNFCTTFAHSLSPLWAFLKNPLLQILSAVGVLLSGVFAAVGLLLSGVLGLLGNILNCLGLGGLVNNFGGLGLDKILKDLVIGKLVGKKEE
ncbi:hypothetical protein Unana1_05448 [Umbelopsis nana]